MCSPHDLDQIELPTPTRCPPTYRRRWPGLLTLLALVGVFGLAVQDALAATATSTSPLTWVAPTEYLDGSTINPEHFKEWRLSIGRESGVYDVAVLTFPEDGERQRPVQLNLGDVNDGDALTLFLSMEVVMDNGDVSPPSSELVRSFIVSIESVLPNPPTQLEWDLQIQCEAAPGLTCTIEATP